VTPGTAAVAGGAAATQATYITPSTLSNTNTLANVYGSPLAFINNTAITGSSTAAAINFLASTAEISKPFLTTGNTIASNMLAELDRKSDDGNPAGGSFRYTDIGVNTIATPFVTAAVSNACWNGAAATGFTWMVNPPGSCQGASLL